MWRACTKGTRRKGGAPSRGPKHGGRTGSLAPAQAQQGSCRTPVFNPDGPGNLDYTNTCRHRTNPTAAGASSDAPTAGYRRGIQRAQRVIGFLPLSGGPDEYRGPLPLSGGPVDFIGSHFPAGRGTHAPYRLLPAERSRFPAGRSKMSCATSRFPAGRSVHTARDLQRQGDAPRAIHEKLLHADGPTSTSAAAARIFAGGLLTHAAHAGLPPDWHFLAFRALPMGSIAPAAHQLPPGYTPASARLSAGKVPSTGGRFRTFPAAAG
jgi:hypothetical protein